MGSSIALHRMQVAVEANATAYRRTAQISAPGDCWDFVVLTAATEKQAHGYRQELALRHRAVGPTGAFFPAIQKSVVVPDPPGRRIGSGGATLNAMRYLAEHYGLSGDDFARLRILLIHSGGASQRLPAYSALGKIFAPLPLLRPDGQVSTLFDHLYVTLAGLPERLGAGLLVAAGDVFLLFDHRHVTTPAPGVTALTMRVDATLASDHGVYVIDSSGQVQRTLQKAPTEILQQAGAVDEQGRILIDTGLLFFDGARIQHLARLAGCQPEPHGQPRTSRKQGPSKAPRGLDERSARQIDLYEDMTAALAAGTDRKAYLANPATAALRKELWNALHGVPFRIMPLEGQFLHLGTTRQFRDAMVGHNPSPAAELFQQNVLAHGHWAMEPGRRVYHSALLGHNGQAGVLDRGSVVEHSILGPSTRISAGSVVSQVLAAHTPIRLPKETLLFQVPVRCPKGSLLYVHVLCGVEDDFKGRFADGQCLFLNKPIGQWLQRHGLDARDIWGNLPAEHRTLWTARLFVGTNQRDAADQVLWLSDERQAPRQTIAAWRKASRYSMAMLLEQADPVALIEHREVVAAYLQTGLLLESLRRNENQPLDTVIGHYSSAAAYEACLGQIEQFAGQPASDPENALQQARALWCAAQLLQRPDTPATPDQRARIDQYMVRAFAKVAEASEVVASVGAGNGQACRVSGRKAAPSAPRITVCEAGEIAIHPGLRIEAAAPVRLDLAGGWSDTPPCCYDRGGHVVNLAINLDNQPPVRAMVRALAEPVLILESNDLAQHVELKSLEPQKKGPNVHDPFALHKVAMEMVGLIPDHRTDLARHLKKLGGGLIVSTECRVPKGSGLGTSSILAATLLAALHEVIGKPAAHEQLMAETLLLEQRLSTGGGWQDQVGGIVGGVKSTTTAPGVPQRPVVEELALSDAMYAALQDRFVVYYSGQQRLARDILRRVMGRWLAREPAVLLLMEELKKSAAALRMALLKGQWTAAGREMARYWQFKKQLYPGSTTPTIDVLFLELQEHYLAAGLAGAGGGGFAYFFCKDAKQANRLRQRLAERSARPGSLGSLYQTQINRTGLVVTRQ